METAIPPGDIETEAPPSLAVPPKIEPSGGVCQHCGSAIEDKYAFCWNCGKPMQATKQSVTKRPKNPSRRLIIDMNDIPDLQASPFDEDDRPASFPPHLPREQKRLKRGNGSGLKLMLVLMVAGVGLVSGNGGNVVAETFVANHDGGIGGANGGFNFAVRAELRADCHCRNDPG
jgi:hypothetical protein